MNRHRNREALVQQLRSLQGVILCHWIYFPDAGLSLPETLRSLWELQRGSEWHFTPGTFQQNSGYRQHKQAECFLRNWGNKGFLILASVLALKLKWMWYKAMPQIVRLLLCMGYQPCENPKGLQEPILTEILAAAFREADIKTAVLFWRQPLTGMLEVSESVSS